MNFLIGLNWTVLYNLRDKCVPVHACILKIWVSVTFFWVNNSIHEMQIWQLTSACMRKWLSRFKIVNKWWYDKKSLSHYFRWLFVFEQKNFTCECSCVYALVNEQTNKRSIKFYFLMALDIFCTKLSGNRHKHILPHLSITDHSKKRSKVDRKFSIAHNLHMHSMFSFVVIEWPGKTTRPNEHRYLF